MNRCNSSKEFIFIDEGVPTADNNNSHIAACGRVRVCVCACACV